MRGSLNFQLNTNLRFFQPSLYFLLFFQSKLWICFDFPSHPSTNKVEILIFNNPPTTLSTSHHLFKKDFLNKSVCKFMFRLLCNYIHCITQNIIIHQVLVRMPLMFYSHLYLFQDTLGKVRRRPRPMERPGPTWFHSFDLFSTLVTALFICFSFNLLYFYLCLNEKMKLNILFSIQSKTNFIVWKFLLINLCFQFWT